MTNGFQNQREFLIPLSGRVKTNEPQQNCGSQLRRKDEQPTDQEEHPE